MNLPRRQPMRAHGFTLIEWLVAILIVLLLITLLTTCVGELMQIRAANVTGITFTGPAALQQGATGAFTGSITLDGPAPDNAILDIEIWEGDGPADDLLVKQRIRVAKGATTVPISVNLRCRVRPTPELLIGANGADDDDSGDWEIYVYIAKVDDDTVIDLAGNYYSSNHIFRCYLNTPDEELPEEE